MPRYLERGSRRAGALSAAASPLPPLAGSGGTLREELERRRTATRLHVRSAANRAFGESMLYTLSDQAYADAPVEASIATSRRVPSDGFTARVEAGTMVEAAIERARRASNDARSGAQEADALATQVRAALDNLAQPQRTIVERATRRQRAFNATTESRVVAFGSGTAESASASERLASSRLDRATRTLSLMRERATMLQLVLQLSRQELELNLQRMRMEEELQDIVTMSRTFSDGLDLDAPLGLSTPQLGVPDDLVDTCAPACSYEEAVAADRIKHGKGSHLPGSGECLICQGELHARDHVRLLRCRHAFHVECVDPWLHRSTHCPTCRADVMAESCAPCSLPDEAAEWAPVA